MVIIYTNCQALFIFFLLLQLPRDLHLLGWLSLPFLSQYFPYLSHVFEKHDTPIVDLLSFRPSVGSSKAVYIYIINALLINELPSV